MRLKTSRTSGTKIYFWGKAETWVRPGLTLTWPSICCNCRYSYVLGSHCGAFTQFSRAAATMAKQSISIYSRWEIESSVTTMCHTILSASKTSNSSQSVGKRLNSIAPCSTWGTFQENKGRLSTKVACADSKPSFKKAPTSSARQSCRSYQFRGTESASSVTRRCRMATKSSS